MDDTTHHPFHRALVVGLVDELREEMRADYERQHEMARQAVLTMRRLCLAEALLELYEEEPPAAEQTPVSVVLGDGGDSARAPITPLDVVSTGGRPRTVNYAEVLAIVAANPGRTIAAVAEYYEIPHDTARSRIKRAQKAARDTQEVIDRVDAACATPIVEKVVTVECDTDAAVAGIDKLVAELTDAAAGRNYEPPRELGRKPQPTHRAKPLPERGTPSGLEWDLPKRPARIPDEMNPDVVHYCACGEERSTLEGIVEHTMRRHGRTATSVERIAQPRREVRRAVPRAIRNGAPA